MNGPHGHLLNAQIPHTLYPLSTIAEVEKLALKLPERDRALLATQLLRSLPAVLEDEGIAEALSRDTDFESNPGIGISMKEMTERIEGRHQG